MEPALPRRARRRARTTALVAALSLLAAPLLAAPGAVAVTDPVPGPTVVTEPTSEPTSEPTDVVAPAPDQLAVTGVLRVGEQVAVEPAPPLWSPTGLTFTYRWFADGVELPGETESVLALGPEIVGTRVSVEVTGTAPDGAVDGAASAAVVVTAQDAVAAGTSTGTAPALPGVVRVGGKVTPTRGSWPGGATFTYLWTVGGVPVGEAAAYTPKAADLGKALALAVTGTAAGYETATRTSTAVTVQAGVLAAPTPALTGTVRVGSKVTAKAGTWTAGTSLKYQWYASGRAISGATRSTYTPTSSVKGKTLTVRVTGTRSGYTTAARTSGGKKVGAGVLSAPKPKIKGAVRVGATVSVARGTWKPSASTYRYQWRVNGTKIKGATKSSYRLPAKYAGKKLTVTVTGSRAGYSTRAVTSVSSQVLRSYTRTSAPTISGSARVGSTLKVSSRGTWTPKPSSWKYQWRADGVAIKGATRSTFKVTGAQYGKRLTVTVQGVRSGYHPSARTSARTARVTVPAAVLTKNGVYRVGTQIKPGTYVAPGSAAGCWVKRLDGSKKPVWTGLTYGRTMVTVRSTDKYFSTSGCGTWRRYAAYGKVRTSTAVDGTYKVGTSGGQLKPGLYYTSGPAYSDDVCYVAALKSFAMTSAAVDESAEFTGPAYWKVLPGDVGVEVYGCSWRRVSG